MTRIRFQQSLDDLKENLLVMAGLAEQAIQRAIEAYRVRDLSICDLVSRSELAINRLEREELPAETVHQAAAILDEAAQKIERL